MADAQDNMTPEEKLLNVIQSGGQKPETSSEKPAAAAKPEAVPVAAAADSKAPVPVVSSETASVKAAVKAAEPEQAGPKQAGKGKMKLAKPAAKDAAAGADENSAAAAKGVEPGAAADDVSAGGAVASGAFVKKHKREGAGITTINRMLAAGILILLGLSGVEVLGVIRGNGVERRLVEIELPAVQGTPVSAVEVQQVFGSDIFWRSPDSAGGGSQTTTQTITVNTAQWADYMKQNIKLMGISMRPDKADSEAILLDNTDKRMYFVKLGSSFSVQGVDVRLDDIESQRARFTDGKNSVELK